MNPDSARLFLGLELNDNSRRVLSLACDDMTAQNLRGKFYTPDRFHLTLCFLGNTPTARIPELQKVMDSVPCSPFSLTLSDLGTFKNGTILWAGVKHCDILHDYRARLADALRNACFPVEEGEYHPHITLARQFKSDMPSMDIPPVSFPVFHATLFESTRINDILTYVPLYRSVFC